MMLRWRPLTRQPQQVLPLRRPAAPTRRRNMRQRTRLCQRLTMLLPRHRRRPTPSPCLPTTHLTSRRLGRRSPQPQERQRLRQIAAQMLTTLRAMRLAAQRLPKTPQLLLQTLTLRRRLLLPTAKATLRCRSLEMLRHQLRRRLQQLLRPRRQLQPRDPLQLRGLRRHGLQHQRLHRRSQMMMRTVRTRCSSLPLTQNTASCTFPSSQITAFAWCHCLARQHRRVPEGISWCRIFARRPRHLIRGVA